MATTLGTPWAQFQSDLAATRQNWWNGVKPDYVTNVNQEAEPYQSAAETA